MAEAATVPGEARLNVTRPQRHALAAILLVGLAVRVPYLWVDTHTSGDLATFVRWAQTAQAHGLTGIYHGTDVDYGPVAVYLLAVAAFVANHLSMGGGALIALIKLPSILADVLTAALVWWTAARRRGAAGMPLLVCGLYLFNPAIWYVSVRWGQIESICTLSLAVTVVALERRRVALAWLAYTLALGTKLSGLALAPLLVAWTVGKFGWRALATGVGVAVATAIVLLAPWLVAGRAGELVHHVYLDLPTEPPRVDVSAYNLWYLLYAGRVRDATSHAEIPLLGVPYQTLGLALFGTLAAAVVVLALRRGGGVALPAATLSLGAFMLLTQMHERHVFPVLALLLLVELGWEYGALSLAFLFNLLTVAPFAGWLAPNLITVDATTARLVLLKLGALAVAAGNLVVLVWLLARLHGAGRRRLGSTA